MGSLVNEVMSTAKAEPEIDGGATILMHSDRRAGTIVAITRFKSGPNKGKAKSVIVREDAAEIVSGSSQDGSAVYEHAYNDSGVDHEFTRTSKGWKDKGGDSLGIGFRETYYDPSF